MLEIDINMPKSCFDCDKTRQWKKTGEVQCPHINMPSISTNRDCRPPYCPLKEVFNNSVLEDIKAEILEYIDDLDIANEILVVDCGIFDKHMKSENSNADHTYLGRGVKIYKEEIEDIY